MHVSIADVVPNLSEAREDMQMRGKRTGAGGQQRQMMEETARAEGGACRHFEHQSTRDTEFGK